MRNSSESEQTVRVLGILAVIIGLVCNEWVLGALFSSKGDIRVPWERFVLWIVDISLVGIGLDIVRNRESRLRARLLRLVETRPNLAAFAFGVGLSGLLLLGVEGLFYLLNKKRAEPISISYQPAFFDRDRLLGWKPKPATRSAVVKKRGDQVVYDVVYTSDSSGRRVTPVRNDPPRSRFALFVTCSFTFGEGLNDDQTIPFYFGEAATDYRPYNYACSGYGPQQMLAQFENGGLRTELAEPEGIAVYTFVDDHIQRVIGSMYVYNLWGRDMPYYFLQDGELERRGSFRTGRRAISSVYHLLGASQTLRFFGVSLPTRVTDKHLRLTSSIIRRSSESFQAQFPHSEFYVVFYPGAVFADQLKPYLENDAVRYLDYTDLFDRFQPRFRIVDDRSASAYARIIDEHPSAHANEIFARKLASDLAATRSN